jgi:hypothetical protein
MQIMITFLFSLFFILGTFSLSNTMVFGESLSELLGDETRATTWYFSVKPLDNWAYQNANYGPENVFGWNSNNAVEMWPNQFDNISIVYGMIAQDAYYTAKNAGLNHYVKSKMNDPMLKYIKESKLLSRENITVMNGTEAIKLSYDNPGNQLNLVLYLLNHNKENYLMFFWSKINLFDKYLPEFEEILKTIKWIE